MRPSQQWEDEAGRLAGEGARQGDRERVSRLVDLYEHCMRSSGSNNVQQEVLIICISHLKHKTETQSSVSGAECWTSQCGVTLSGSVE